ncbi:hypothetical protein [Donghicola tyrosinivorans]|uniref:Uncharacterized protein n=1 Tax=Donghicola tyrosinivorans TaxID=1652492 RepID=A0A2T0WJA8_9RHOB|nr:hypothetical protein [Donghicola tyrosinivorans]PRY86777.1 hypothetical protein CLV74_1116 [Donghicola tyrosinivorans]
MATTLKQTETIPSYPSAPSGLSEKAAAIDPGAIWSRIEAYTAYRYSPRSVVWICEGPGEWTPPLADTVLGTCEMWTGEGWTPYPLKQGPLGGVLLYGEGPYRITGTTGSQQAPKAVLEAYRRYSEYMAEETGAAPATGGSTGGNIKIGDAMELSFERPGNWIARALQNSGAADLLRPYRRA